MDKVSLEGGQVMRGEGNDKLKLREWSWPVSGRGREEQVRRGGREGEKKGELEEGKGGEEGKEEELFT